MLREITSEMRKLLHYFGPGLDLRFINDPQHLRQTTCMRLKATAKLNKLRFGRIYQSNFLVESKLIHKSRHDLTNTANIYTQTHIFC